MDRNDIIAIGTLAKRTGLAASAIRFYESRGLIEAQRTSGNQRRYLRSDIRRLSFIVVAQRLGLALDEIESLMQSLPRGRTPSVLDWQRLGRTMRAELDARIQLLTRTRSRLDECIGCGCMSLDKCRLTNRDDRAAAAGPGPRYLLN